MNSKETLRREALARRRAMPADARSTASAAIRQRLLGQLAQDTRLQGAPLLLYRSLGDEVDTAPLFEAAGEGMDARRLYAPVTHHAGHMHWRHIDAETRWQRGDFGVLEPVSGEPWPESEPVVLACPLVGFDRAGNRLGLGKGCFDRWLGGVKSHMLLIVGLAFACQECPAIPAEAHDVPLDIVITEKESIACRSY